jgi:hypothetical protein
VDARSEVLLVTGDVVRYEVRERKAYLTLNRPDRRGYMPARVWGCPTTAMWVYRLGAGKAKRMLLTGDTIDGRTAAEWGLLAEAVSEGDLDAAVERLADRIAGVPVNQLVMQKLMINQAYDNMGLHGGGDPPTPADLEREG